MLDAAKLEALKNAAEREEWKAAGDIYSELGLQAHGSVERFLIGLLAPPVQLRDAERLVVAVEQLLTKLPSQS